MLTLYDAARCPYCARVRIVLAEKGVEFETVEIDLDDRPAWIYEKNATGRVPVLEEDAFVLPESDVICEYLEERYPEPPLLPADPAERALARLAIFRFDDRLGDDYYALRRGEEAAAGRWTPGRARCWTRSPGSSCSSALRWAATARSRRPGSRRSGCVGSRSWARAPRRTRPSGARAAPRRSRRSAAAAPRRSGRTCARSSSPTARTRPWSSGRGRSPSRSSRTT